MTHLKFHTVKNASTYFSQGKNSSVPLWAKPKIYDKVVKCGHIFIVDFPREYVKYANEYHWTTYLEYIFF